MSFESQTSDSSVGPFARLDFSHLLASTLALVSATILLGVAAKATGSGLACDANWPLCDGGVLNLFPATFPSFFEWIHRVVAMFAGVSMIGTAVAAVRGAVGDRRVVAAVVLGLLLTPIQVYLGAETVLSYDLPILQAHFWLALVIFTCFVLATVLVWARRLTARHVTAALLAAAASVPIHVLLSPLFIGSYTPVIQTIQYAAVLVLLGSVLLASTVGRRRFEWTVLSRLLLSLPVLALVVLVFGRRAVMTYAPALDALYVVSAAVLFFVLLAGVALSVRSSRVMRPHRTA